MRHTLKKAKPFLFGEVAESAASDGNTFVPSSLNKVKWETTNKGVCELARAPKNDLGLFYLSCWKKGVSKILNLLKKSKSEERKRHTSNTFTESRAVTWAHGSFNSHLLYLKQCRPFRCGWYTEKKATLEVKPLFFFQAMMMHKRQIHPQMPRKGWMGNQQANGKAEQKMDPGNKIF